MIRIKFLYSVEEHDEALHDKIICEYDPARFMDIVNELVPQKEEAPPFRDEDSEKFIYEIDHAKFVKDDWYSIVNPEGRTCLTALSDGTQYALTVIYNSRHGQYTSLLKFETDIWSRLADLSIDVLIFVEVYINNVFPV